MTPLTQMLIRRTFQMIGGVQLDASIHRTPKMEALAPFVTVCIDNAWHTLSVIQFQAYARKAMPNG